MNAFVALPFVEAFVAVPRSPLNSDSVKDNFTPPWPASMVLSSFPLLHETAKSKSRTRDNVSFAIGYIVFFFILKVLIVISSTIRHSGPGFLFRHYSSHFQLHRTHLPAGPILASPQPRLVPSQSAIARLKV
ncbi:hypothetical protein D3C73_1303350 [compost metagenome]